MGCSSGRQAMKQPGEEEPVFPAQMVDRCEHQIGYQYYRRKTLHFLEIWMQQQTQLQAIYLYRYIELQKFML